MLQSNQTRRPGRFKPAACNSWTQRTGAFAGLPELIRYLGADPVMTLAGADLASDALVRAESMIPYAALGRLLRDCAARTGCAHFGLLAGRMRHLKDLGLLGELVANSPTVGEALQALSIYQHFNSGGGLAFLIDHGGMVDVGYAIYHPGLAGVDQVYDCFLAGGFNFLRELCGPGWVPAEVLIPHAEPSDPTHFRNFFKVHPRFNSEICALRFPSCWMQRPVAGADPRLRRIAEERARMARPAELLQQVFRASRILLLNGKFSGDDVAHMLSMHRRTLNRRLKAEGTTFHEVLDCVRFEVARQLLAGSEISLDDVAATLGYAGISPFMRSFRRWAGTTPGRWRRAAGCGQRRDGESSHRADSQRSFADRMNWARLASGLSATGVAQTSIRVATLDE